MVVRIDRQEFLYGGTERYPDGVFDYRSGEHVLLIGPTQRAGKSYLGWQLLESALRPSLRATAFCMKPRDRTVAHWQRELGFKETPAWPPPSRWFWQQKPAGHTLWPRHTFDPESDDPHLRAELRKLMLSSYKRGDCILWLDEIYGLIAELGLQKELLALLTRGGVMNCGVWMATQKPSGTQAAGIPGFVFNSPTHMFLSKDNVKQNRQRYGDLAGDFDPKLIERISLQLRPFEFLYLHSAGHMCVVGA